MTFARGVIRLLTLIMACVWRVQSSATTQRLTVRIINVFPSSDGVAATIYDGNGAPLINVSYNETKVVTLPPNSSIQVARGNERVNATRRLESEAALVVSQSDQGDMQADLIQMNDRLSDVSQSGHVQLAFFDASIKYSLDCSAVNVRTHEMFQLRKGVKTDNYALTLVPIGDYEFKVFSNRKINHVDDFKNSMSSTNTIWGNFPVTSKFHLVIVHGNGKIPSEFPARMEIVPPPDPPIGQQRGPEVDLIIMNAVKRNGRLRVKKYAKPLRYGEWVVVRAYIEKGHTITVSHTKFGDSQVTVRGDVPYVDGKCYLLADLANRKGHYLFDCWQNRNIQISNTTSWLLIANSLTKCSRMNVIGYGNISSKICKTNCEQLLLLSGDLEGGYATRAEFPSGLLQVKSYPYDNPIADDVEFLSRNGTTPEVYYPFQPGQTYFSALMGECENDAYPPQFVIAAALAPRLAPTVTVAPTATVHVINVFPSPNNATVHYNGKVLLSIKYNGTERVLIEVNSSLVVTQGKERVTVAGRVESKGALVISQSSQGRLQVDLIQRSDSQSSQDQVEMIFYNASIGYSLDCFAVNSRLQKMFQLGKGVIQGEYNRTLLPPGDYEFKIFPSNKVRHIDNYKNVLPSAKPITGNFPLVNKWNLLVVYGNGKLPNEYPARMTIAPQPSPSTTRHFAPRVELIIMNTVRSSGQFRVKNYTMNSLRYGRWIILHEYIEKGQTLIAYHTDFGDKSVKVTGNVPYAEGKCVLLADLANTKVHYTFNCWQNSNISVSSSTSWLFSISALEKCGINGTEILAYGNVSREFCTKKPCTQLLLVAGNLQAGYGVQASFQPGSLEMKVLLAGTVSDLKTYQNNTGLTPNVYQNFEPGKTYFSALIGECGNDRYPPRYVIVSGKQRELPSPSSSFPITSPITPTSSFAFIVFPSYQIIAIMTALALI